MALLETGEQRPAKMGKVWGKACQVRRSQCRDAGECTRQVCCLSQYLSPRLRVLVVFGVMADGGVQRQPLHLSRASHEGQVPQLAVVQPLACSTGIEGTHPEERRLLHRKGSVLCRIPLRMPHR
jgi:hypothetical protein